LPAGFVGGLEQDPVEVPPGVSNFLDVSLTLTPTPGTALGNRPFTVTAVSTQKPAIRDMAEGTVTVVSSGVTVDLSPNSGSPNSAFQLLVRNTGQSQDTFDLALGGPVGIVSTLDTNTVTLNPGVSQNIPVTVGAIDFAFAGSLELVGTATSRSNPTVKDSDTAAVVITSTQSMEAEFDPATVTLPQPGAATFLLLVHNTGNTEDAYMAQIMGTSGPVTASLDGLDGQPIQQLELFRLPGK
jgi:large repetitive protein